MAQTTIGKTGLWVEQNGFGALPIQRISKKEGAKVLNETEGQESAESPERAAAKNPPAWGAEAKVRATD